MLVATPEKGAPAGSREHNPQRWVSLKIATNRKIVAVPADEPLCQIIEQRVHDFQGSLFGANELGNKSELVAGQPQIGSRDTILVSPGHWTLDGCGWAGSTCHRRPAHFNQA